MLRKPQQRLPAKVAKARKAVVTSKRFPEVDTAVYRSDTLRPSDGEESALPQAATKTVLQNKSSISWACEPDRTGIGACIFFSPEIVPPCPQKGVQTIVNRNGAFSACLPAFWRAAKLTTKPFVLLDTPTKESCEGNQQSNYRQNNRNLTQAGR